MGCDDFLVDKHSIFRATEVTCKQISLVLAGEFWELKPTFVKVAGIETY